MHRTACIARTLLLLAQLAGAATAAPVAVAAAEPPAVARKQGHEHVWVKFVVRQEWIPPVTSKQITGYDAKGNPIYKEVVVRPGYWKKIYGHRCNVCGKTKNN
jgi:hypothetical protein